ncbi:hypothetical protein SK128_011626 [Halocaridina rubra]|uniref:Uncharacterized protein n=1 Tax=Halocaridina rubra TaxID=373956 RepID=A0AAN8WHX0_HALRR
MAVLVGYVVSPILSVPNYQMYSFIRDMIVLLAWSSNCTFNSNIKRLFTSSAMCKVVSPKEEIVNDDKYDN